MRDNSNANFFESLQDSDVPLEYGFQVSIDIALGRVLVVHTNFHSLTPLPILFR
jgi:hypothetical protein